MHEEPLATVHIGGREVSLLVAALLAQQAEVIGILPAKVGDVVLPEPPPTHVVLAGLELSVLAAALIAVEADQRQMLIPDVMAAILDEEVAPRRVQSRGPYGDA